MIVSVIILELVVQFMEVQYKKGKVDHMWPMIINLVL